MKKNLIIVLILCYCFSCQDADDDTFDHTTNQHFSCMFNDELIEFESDDIVARGSDIGGGITFGIEGSKFPDNSVADKLTIVVLGDNASLRTYESSNGCPAYDNICALIAYADFNGNESLEFYTSAAMNETTATIQFEEINLEKDGYFKATFHGKLVNEDTGEFANITNGKFEVEIIYN